MKIKFKMLLIVAAALFNTTYAQVSSYAFQQFNSTYTPLTNANMLGNVMQDDDTNRVGLPFVFNFNGSNYNSVLVNSNGYLTFGIVSPAEYFPIQATGPAKIIAPLNQDLLLGTVIKGDLTAGSNIITNVSNTVGISAGDSIWDINFDFGGINPVITAIGGNTIALSLNSQNTYTGSDLFLLNGCIKTKLSGVSPNRVFEIEYINASRFTVYNEVLNFKVSLFETTNKIRFSYGLCKTGLATFHAQVGLKGNGLGDFNIRLVNSTGTWSTSVAGTNFSDECWLTQSVFPNSGLVYEWSPVACSVPSISVVSSNTLLCSGQTATLTASGASAYSWSNGASLQQIIINPSTTTTYTLIGSNGSCTNTATFTQLVSLCTNVNESHAGIDNIRIYPSLFNDQLTINNIINSLVYISIYDATGRIVDQRAILGDTKQTIETSEWAKGIYILTISDKEHNIRKKIIKD